MTTLGFVGVGELAVYTVRGLRRGGYRGPILLSPRNRDKAGMLQRECGCERVADNQAVVDGSDYVILATRPAQCLETLSGLEFRNGQVLISVVAGVGIERLRGALPAELDILRAMPVSSAEAGASPTLLYPPNDFASELFDYCGESITVEQEAWFDQGSVLACVYSWFFELYQTLIEATEGPALPRELSRRLVTGMAAGAARLALAKPNAAPGDIARAIATDGTFSKLGLDLLERERAFDAWADACRLLEERLSTPDQSENPS